MTPTTKSIYSTLPRAEGLLESLLVDFVQRGDFNREGAAKVINKVIGLIREVKLNLEENESNLKG